MESTRPKTLKPGFKDSAAPQHPPSAGKTRRERVFTADLLAGQMLATKLTESVLKLNATRPHKGNSAVRLMLVLKRTTGLFISYGLFIVRQRRESPPTTRSHQVSVTTLDLTQNSSITHQLYTF